MNAIIQMMKEAVIEWEFWLTVITSFVAVIALFQTNKQTKLSNKQHLFDRRLQNYQLASNLIHLYESNILSFYDEDTDGRVVAARIHLISLTKDNFFENVCASDNGFDREYGKALIQARNKLRNSAVETTLIFKGKESEDISTFVLCYEHVLLKLYSFIHAFDDTLSSSTVVREIADEEEYFQSICTAYEKLADAYATQKRRGSLEKLQMQIRLK